MKLTHAFAHLGLLSFTALACLATGGSSGPAPEGRLRLGDSWYSSSSSQHAMVEEGTNYLAAADEVTPELDELADALGNDPLRMLEWVRNNVEFVPYYGLKRGAHLTQIERAGNDFDQCALLMALLKAANISATYRFGDVNIETQRADGHDAEHWLDVDASEMDAVIRKKDGIKSPVGPYPGDTSKIKVRRVWIVATINGQAKVLDPAFKPRKRNSAVNLSGGTTYTESGFWGITGGNDQPHYVQSLNLSSIRSRLSQHTGEFVSHLRSALHSESAAAVSGVSEPIITRLDALPDSLHAACEIVGTPETWTGIPQQHALKFQLSAGTLSLADRYTAELRGRKLAVWIVNRKIEVWLGDELIGEETGTLPSSNDTTLTYGFVHPVVGGPTQSATRPLHRLEKATTIVYAFDQTLGRLQEALERQSEYVAAGRTNNDRELLTENLNVIGLQYKAQLEAMTAIYCGVTNGYMYTNHFGGLFHQKDAISTDIPLNVVTLERRTAGGRDPDDVFILTGYLASGLEHLATEQAISSKAFSTTKLLERSMALGDKIYLLNASTYSANKPQLQNYTTIFASAIPSIENAVLNNGARLLIPQNSNMSYEGTTGGAYFLQGGNGGDQWIVTGGLFGSHATANEAPDSNKVSTGKETAETAASKSATAQRAKSNDPVDLTNGAFTKDDVDLVLGNEGEPNGLHLARNYNSARRAVDPVGLGRGWTHSFDLRLQFRSPNDFDVQRASAVDVAPFIVASQIMTEVFSRTGSAKKYVVPAVVTNWALEQLLGTRASITLGERSIEFTRLPDTSSITYVPRSSNTAELTRLSDGSHQLAFRHGNTIAFRASDGRFTTIKDPFNNTLTASYNGTKLGTVADAYNRIFTFNYSGDRLTGVSDSTGRSVAYGRDGNGHFTFTDSELKTQTFEWNGDFLLTKIIDARGRTVVENDYDSRKRVYRQRTFGEGGRTSLLGIAPGVGVETDPLGQAVWIYFDSRGRKALAVDQAGQLTKWRYDGADRLVQTVTPKGYTTTFGYNANHVLVSETTPATPAAPAGHTRTIDPDSQHRPWKVRNFEGQETVFTYTAQHRVETVTAPGGIVSSFQYDPRGRLWKAHPTAYAANEFDTYAYDANGHVDKITHPADAHAGDQDFDDYLYNARGDLLELIDRKDVKTTFEYNARRQPRKTIQWEGSTQRVTETVYDDTGDVDYTLDASGRKTDSEHDALGHLTQVKRGPLASQVVTLTNSYADPRTLLTSSTDALGNAVAYTYHATHQVATVKDPLNRTTTFGYDEDQRRVTVQTPLGFVTTEVFDSRNFKDGAQDAENQLVDYAYDKDGRMTSLGNRMTPPNSFSWIYDDANRTVTATTPTGKTTTSAANTRGLPATAQEPSGQTTTFNTYDAEGRLIQKTDGVGTTTYTYWPNGLPKDVTENGHTTHREYDALNRLNLYQDGEGNSIGYQYLPSGELWKLAYPGNKVVTYDYDDFGRLWKVTDWSGRVTTYTYDDASRLTRIDRPNGTYRLQEYDAASQLRFIKEYKSGGAIVTFQELKYDDDGRITSNFIHPKPPAITLASDDLLYDADNRLSSWNAQNVTFDNDGNMTNGPLPSGTFGGYGYDSRNRLTSAGGSSYRYSPDGLRVEITGSGAATFVIDPNAALSRTLMRTKGGVTTYYVYGLGLLHEETGGSPKYYHADQVGSTLAMTDASGNVTDTWTYAPFGSVATRTGTTDTPFQFNGELGVQTDASGLLHMRARYYNPRLMRFLNADPIGFDGGLNWYAYCGNNPISYVSVVPGAS